MARVEIPLGARQEKARSPFVSSQSLVNAYTERLPDSGWAIYGGPGLDEFAECGDGPIRGVDHFNETVLAVAGDTLYSVDANGNETAIGPIPGYDPVIIANNGSQAVIQSDSTSYVLESDLTTLSALNDPDFQRSSSVAYLKQTIISTVAGTSRFQTSELADAEAYNALDIATAEAKPDNLLRGIVSGQEWLAMGGRSVEGYYFSGKADGVPLSPTQTYLDYGLAGRMAVCGVDNTIAWLSHLLDFRTLRDQTPLAIADPAIAAMVQGWTNPETVQLFSFAVSGHEWMAARHDDGCILYDATTRMWSMRQSHGLDSWRVSSSVWAYNKNIMGDAVSGKLWALNPNTYAEGSSPLVRQLVSRTIGPGGAPFTLDLVELEVEPGVGLATGQGSDPKAWMQLSRDGGETWGARMERSIGAMGNRNVRVKWQGPFGDFLPHGGVIRFGISDPVRFAATKCWAEYTVNQP